MELSKLEKEKKIHSEKSSYIFLNRGFSYISRN